MQAEAADPHWLVGRFAGARPAPGEEINKVQAVRRFRGRRPRRGPACLHHGIGVAPSLPHTRLSSGLHGAAPRPRTGINETSEASLPAIYAVAGPVEYLPCRFAWRTDRNSRRCIRPSIAVQCFYYTVRARTGTACCSVARLVIHCHWHGLLACFALICLCPSRPVGLICPLVLPASACELPTS